MLLTNPRAAWLWLPLRIWLGYQWVTSSLGKINNPAWVSTGEALKGFWTNAVQIPESGRPPITFDWYRGFIQFLLDSQSYTWFAKLVAYGEMVVGIALILGAFTGFAAFFSGFMNWNFMMAGSASTNPLLFIAAVGLILAWRIAGYLGADYFLLPGSAHPGRTSQIHVKKKSPKLKRVTASVAWPAPINHTSLYLEEPGQYIAAALAHFI
jgi:thiosulfate dehydrogenase [quinone] large subunit